ncbi:MAG TPA: pilus assembly protein PilM [Phycisphaerales bacterium]|nr:pilus assembly protein PilM [Phycisphaerales bacterium]
MGLPFLNSSKQKTPAGAANGQGGNGGFSRFAEKLSSSMGSNLGLGNTLGMPIAIDFGTGALKILQVNTGQPPAMQAIVCLETPQALIGDNKRRMEFQLSALPKLVKKGGFKGKRAVCSIPAWQTTCKHLQFPRQDGVPLAQLVAAAIPQQLGVDPASLVYRFIEVSNKEKSNNKVDVVLIAVERAVVDRLMETLVEAKLEPVGIQSEFMCTVRAFDDIHRRLEDNKANTLYLDIGASTTKVMITHGRTLVFARMIDVGGRHLDAAIAKQMNVDEVTARQMRLALDAETEKLFAPAASAAPASAAEAEVDRRKDQAPPGFTEDITKQPTVAVAPAGANLLEPLEIITDEVRLCLRYHASQFPGQKVDRIIFVGGESRHRGLTQHIARVLKLSAQIADPLARVARTGTESVLGIDLKQPQPGWAVALGLCLAPTDL